MPQSFIPKGEYHGLEGQLRPRGLSRGVAPLEAREGSSRMAWLGSRRGYQGGGTRPGLPSVGTWPGRFPPTSSQTPTSSGRLARGQPSAWPSSYLLHWTLSRPVAALFSSSVVFCSCTEAPAASSGSLLRSMITISISGSRQTLG